MWEGVVRIGDVDNMQTKSLKANVIPHQTHILRLMVGNCGNDDDKDDDDDDNDHNNNTAASALSHYCNNKIRNKQSYNPRPIMP